MFPDRPVFSFDSLIERRRAMGVMALAPLLTSLPWQAQAQGSALRLVSHGELTGSSASQYNPWIAAAQAVFDRANKSGGVGGRPIELIKRDTGGKPKLAEEMTRKSLTEDNPLAFFGFGGGLVVEAVLPLLGEARVPMLATFSGSDELRGVTPYMFHIRPGFKAEVVAIVRQMKSMGLSKVAVAVSNRHIGKNGMEQIEAMRAGSGIDWTFQPFKTDGSDMAIAAQSLAKVNAQALLVLAPAGPGVALIQAVQKAGYQGQIYGLSVLSAANLYKELGANSRGITLTQANPLPNSKVPFVRDDFNKLMAVAGITNPQVEHVEGYIAARVMLEALRRAGPGVDRDSLVKALEGLRNFDLGGYVVDFGPGRREGSQQVFITMITVDGRLVA